MAVVKPLVEKDGEIERLQPTDSLDVGADTYQNIFTSTAIPGQPVYADSNTSVQLAQANASVTSKVVGIAKEGVTLGNPGPVVHDGLIELSTSLWDNVTGQSGGLTLGSTYYLSDVTAGMLLVQTNLATIGQGETVVPIGQAISDTEMLIKLRRTILR